MRRPMRTFEASHPTHRFAAFGTGCNARQSAASDTDCRTRQSATSDTDLRTRQSATFDTDCRSRQSATSDTDCRSRQSDAFDTDYHECQSIVGSDADYSLSQSISSLESNYHILHPVDGPSVEHAPYPTNDYGADCQIPRLGRLEIENRAKALLDECSDGSFPINIEMLCDYLGVAVIPVVELKNKFGVDAFTAADFKTIYVDDYGFRTESNRYRFSMAHEIGHFVLHREYFSSRVDNLEEWMGSSIKNGCGYAEYQANCFAGYLLAPEDELIRALDTEFDGSFVKNYYQTKREKYINALVKTRRLFRVSEQVVARRVRDTIYGLET